MKQPARRPAAPRWARLEAPNWNPATRLALQKLLQEGAGQNLPVVFDFDNTIICGDVGEATLAVLARSGQLNLERVPPSFAPAFRAAGKPRLTPGSCADVAEYYEAFLAPTAHGSANPTPLANGYVWAVEILEGLRPLDVVKATRTAFELAQPGQAVQIEVTPGKTSFPAPFFYPEMVELLAALVRLGFDVWVVSASNVWSVRWMVLHALNPQLLAQGAKPGLAADHVVGISTLLADRRDRLYKDSLLVRERAGYAALTSQALSAFRLTSRLHFPVPTYSGKVACLFDTLGRQPYLAVGDSPGDHPMLAYSRHRLWIARLEKPAYQEATLQLMRKTGRAGWMIQPTCARDGAGFVPDGELLRRSKPSAELLQSEALLASMQAR